MKITRIDHLVLTVQDIDHAAQWYHRVFEMEIVVTNEGHKALEFGAEGARQRLHLHRVGHAIEPHARHATTGSADLCLIAAKPVAELLEELRRDNVDLATEGIVRREGAMGPLESIYVRDLDGNLIEISEYPREHPNESFERYR